MGLPLNLPYQQMQQKWKSQIDPVLANPLNGINVLKDISLASGSNTINHLLGRVMQGWIIVDQQGVASFYRPNTSPFNALTLTLVSSAAVVCSIGVF